MRAGNLLLLPILLLDCVGDSTPVDDAGGNDATTNDVVVADSGGDAGKDVNDGGASTDADAAANKHVYAASFTGGTLLVFDQPLTSASQPTVVLPANFKTPSDIEILPGGLQLLVVDGTAMKIFIFDLPVTTTSVATTAFPIDIAGVDSTFDNEGNLWVVGNATTKIEKFTPPFTNTSTPSQTITMPSTGLVGVNVANNDVLHTGGYGHIYKLSLPTDAGTYPNGGVDNTSVAFPTGIAFDNNAMFVSNLNAGAVEDFGLPLLTNSTATAVGTTVLGNPTRLRLAPNGALGVADAKIGIVMLDSPAFNTAAVIVPAGDAAVHDIRAICFGP